MCTFSASAPRNDTINPASSWTSNLTGDDQMRPVRSAHL